MFLFGVVTCLIHAYDRLCNWMEGRVGSWTQRVGGGGVGGAKHLGKRMIGKH